MTTFRTLSHALQDVVAGARVTHALFTTYAFEAEFFEANIVPLLLGSIEGMSIHDGVRRLQLNEKLCAMPDDERPKIEVFVDASVAKTGVPWLPYNLHAIRTAGAFHGKVILVRLESDDGSGQPEVKWVLGCGSANLTLAGWWENIETWHFTRPFSARAVPADLHADLVAMLGWLRSVSPDHRHPVLDAWSAAAPQPSPRTSGQRFAAFLGPSSDRFLARFRQALDSRASKSEGRELEVVSPYFCEKDHGPFADAVSMALDCTTLRIWLPVDIWNKGFGLLTEAQFKALDASGASQCASLTKGGPLRDAATPETIHNKPPRFTHAKVIRVPGELTFIGSVNFSRAAFDVNFEAGFFFDDNGGEWLEQTTAVPSAFLADTPSPGENDDVTQSAPAYDATFDWKTKILTVRTAANFESRYSEATLTWREPVSQTTREIPLNTPVSEAALIDNFRNQPTIELDWRLSEAEQGTTTVWVHQEHLDWRPIPEELKLDVWSMIDLWRSTEGKRIGGHERPWQRILERIELQQRISPDAPVGAPVHEDIFARMTHIHGAFRQLREQMRPGTSNDAEAHKREELARYYLCTERTDSLKTMLARIETESGADAFDEIESWVVLHWIKQIAEEHPPVGEPLAGLADALIESLRATRLNGVPKAKLDWLSTAFLGEPDGHADSTRDTETETADDAR